MRDLSIVRHEEQIGIEPRAYLSLYHKIISQEPPHLVLIALPISPQER